MGDGNTITKTYGLTHLAVLVKDLKRTVAFYQHVFGMEVMYDQGPDGYTLEVWFEME